MTHNNQYLVPFENIEVLREAARIIGVDHKAISYHIAQGHVTFPDGSPAWRKSGRTVLVDMDAVRRSFAEHSRSKK